MIRKYILVTGRVQGVGFRWFAKRTACGLGLAGYARNRADGGVELEVQGEEAAVEQFVDAMSAGPGYARVDAVETRTLPPADVSGFHTL